MITVKRSDCNAEALAGYHYSDGTKSWSKDLIIVPIWELRSTSTDSLHIKKQSQAFSLVSKCSLHRVYEYTCHSLFEAKDFISSCLSCSVRLTGISQSSDSQLDSYSTRPKNRFKRWPTSIRSNLIWFEFWVLLDFSRSCPLIYAERAAPYLIAELLTVSKKGNCSGFWSLAQLVFLRAIID